MKILFVGESWLGSDARTLKEALRRNRFVQIDEVNEDLYYPRADDKLLRVIIRISGPRFRKELFRQVYQRVKYGRPDVVLVAKGSHFSEHDIEELKSLGPKIILRFPDACPLVHGDRLRRSIGHYNLVLSAKPQHPKLWDTVYGYTNRCICVPHGYNPELHLWKNIPDDPPNDIVMVASGRSEYREILDALAGNQQVARLNVVIGGDRWAGSRAKFPKHWQFVGPVLGEAYVNTLRSGKIVLAPLTTRVVVDGENQPGDVDSARTYELAAAGCFFIHRHSEFITKIYDPRTEVPLFSNAADLIAKIKYYLSRPVERRRMASAAHRRAVPDYSIDARASEMLVHLRSL